MPSLLSYLPLRVNTSHFAAVTYEDLEAAFFPALHENLREMVEICDKERGPRSDYRMLELTTVGMEAESTVPELLRQLTLLRMRPVSAKIGLMYVKEMPDQWQVYPLGFLGSRFHDIRRYEDGPSILVVERGTMGDFTHRASLYSVEAFSFLPAKLHILVALAPSSSKRDTTDEKTVPYPIDAVGGERFGLALLERLFPGGIDPLFMSERFDPIELRRHTGPIGRRQVFRTYQCPQAMDTAEVLTELTARQLLPALAHESFRFYFSYPNSAPAQGFTALGSTMINESGWLCVPRLGKNETGKRTLRQTPFDQRWPKNSVFLGVEPSPE